MAHLTRNEILSAGRIAPEYEKAATTRPITLDTTTLLTTRHSRASHLERLRPLYPIPGPIPTHVTETTHSIPVRDGSRISARVYQPVSGPPDGGSPLIVMYHEGGWSMGDLSDEDMNCRMFCRELGAVCVNVEYRLAPEHKFPTGIHDSYDALKWALANCSTLNATPSRGLLVGGASAGGNIAAVVSLLARDDGLQPPITGQYLCCPALLPDTNVPPEVAHLYQSRTSNTSDPVLKPIQPGAIEEIYAPEQHSGLWDPYNYPGGHKGVAKAFFQMGGIDILRDEAVLYDRKLREEGVLTRFVLYPGYGHMFWTNYPELERSRDFVKDTLEGVRWLLE